jgi:hypothetical protein
LRALGVALRLTYRLYARAPRALIAHKIPSPLLVNSSELWD